jgi:hypothetical protein
MDAAFFFTPSRDWETPSSFAATQQWSRLAAAM